MKMCVEHFKRSVCFFLLTLKTETLLIIDTLSDVDHVVIVLTWRTNPIRNEHTLPKSIYLMPRLKHRQLYTKISDWLMSKLRFTFIFLSSWMFLSPPSFFSLPTYAWDVSLIPPLYFHYYTHYLLLLHSSSLCVGVVFHSQLYFDWNID